MNNKSVLNIGAGPGRIIPEILNTLDGVFLVNLDIYYPDSESDDLGEIGRLHRIWNYRKAGDIRHSNKGWEEFISNYRHYFDVVTLYRFLEHVKMTQVPYFLYMISTILEDGGTVQGIVPDYRKLASRILKEDPLHDKRFEADNI